MGGDTLILIEHADTVTVKRGADKITVPDWVAELVNCGFTNDEGRLVELYRTHVKSPDDTLKIVIFASILVGWSRQQTSERLQAVIQRHTH